MLFDSLKMQVCRYKYLSYKLTIIQSCRRALCTGNQYFGLYKINRCPENNVSLVTKYNQWSSTISFHPILHRRLLSSNIQLVDSVTFEKVCDETLESLCDYFEELIESVSHLQAADVQYGDGVLTVNFGNPYGTYVINRQSPNRQIWLSSPTSGPKRYDFVTDGNYWTYRHDNVTLHQLLQEEIKPIVKKDLDFSQCAYSLLKK